MDFEYVVCVFRLPTQQFSEWKEFYALKFDGKFQDTAFLNCGKVNKLCIFGNLRESILEEELAGLQIIFSCVRRFQ